jgi:hypothetical protein
MTLPGFNAETSLYKASVHYRRLIGTFVQAASVTPAGCVPVGNTGECICCNELGGNCHLRMCRPT